MDINFILLFITIAGFIIGLGAVTVIDLHGFLGQKSGYWTRATIQTHKVTKPLIWIGTFLYLTGIIVLEYAAEMFPWFLLQLLIVLVLILNGVFLSFYVSPRLLNREKAGESEEILPKSLQNKIVVSFIISFAGWWGSVALFAYSVASTI